MKGQQRHFMLFLLSCLVLGAATATTTTKTAMNEGGRLRPKRLRHKALIRIEQPEDIYRTAKEFGEEEERIQEEEDIIRALQISRELQSMQRVGPDDFAHTADLVNGIANMRAGASAIAEGHKAGNGIAAAKQDIF